MEWARSSGILMHPTSLPGRFGIGDLGEVAYRWIDFLVQGGQKLWQVLPLGPTGFADSPYACFSAFAGNPLLISLERLVQEGELRAEELQDAPPFPEDEVDYGAVIAFKAPLLEKAATRFLARASAERRAATERWAAYERFCAENAEWLDDYALFMAVKERFDQSSWIEWDGDIARRRPEAMARWRRETGERIALHQALQFFFFEQWRELCDYAHAREVQIIGDVPIFVAPDSADVWAHLGLFYLDQGSSDRGPRPTLVSGVPPDYFSATGQRWGNPLYRWEVMAEQGYAWWISRIRAVLRTVDIVRIDHFRGFVAYWEIPASEPTAVRGRWVPGPGAALFEAIERELGQLPILAEDLGVITPEVIALRERFGFPGMKILQFAFDESALHASFGEPGPGWRNPFLPHNYTPHFVAYTGTHDNNTAVGWFQSAPDAERQKAMAYLGADAERPCGVGEFHWALIRAVMASVAQMAIVPLQDVLGLGSEARMNLPGTVGGNWRWRCPPEALDDRLAGRLAEMVKLYER